MSYLCLIDHAFRLRYKLYESCGAPGGVLTFPSSDSCRPEARFKAWVETRGSRRASSTGRGGEVRLQAPYGEGLIGGPASLPGPFFVRHPFRFRRPGTSCPGSGLGHAWNVSA